MAVLLVPGDNRALLGEAVVFLKSDSELRS